MQKAQEICVAQVHFCCGVSWLQNLKFCCGDQVLISLFPEAFAAQLLHSLHRQDSQCLKGIFPWVGMGSSGVTFGWVRTWTLHNDHTLSINRSFLRGK